MPFGEHLLAEDVCFGRQIRWRVEDADHVCSQAVGDESAKRVSRYVVLGQHRELPGRRQGWRHPGGIPGKMRVYGVLVPRCATIEHDASQGIGGRERQRFGRRAHVHEAEEMLEASLAGVGCLYDSDVSGQMSGEGEVLPACFPRRGEESLTR